MTDKRKNGNLRRLAAVVLLTLGLLPASIAAHPGSGIAVDRKGELYFIDTGSGLWKLDGHGKLSHLSNTLFHWLALDENNLFATGRLPSSAGTSLDWQILKVGTSPSALLSSDWPIALGQDGALYYQSGRAGSLRIMRSLASGVTSVFATLPETASGKPLADLNGLAPGPANSLYYTENNVIRRVTAEGRIGIVATVPAAARRVSIPATDEHPYLRGLAIDSRGVMYVADSGDARVLKITPRGEITTLVQIDSPWSPTAVALFGSELYVLEFLHTVTDVRREWMPRIRKITSDGNSTIILTVDKMPGAR